MKKLILISSLVLAVGLGVGCSNEKTKKTDEPKKEAVQKEKELTAKDVFNKANEAFKNEENVTMTYDVGIKAEGTEMNVIKAKMQLEPKKKNSRSEMNVSGTEVVVYDVGGKIAGQLKNPNTGEIMSVPEEQLNANGMNATQGMVDNLEIPSEILNKVKMEKSGDNYKLKFALKGQETESMLASMDEKQKKMLQGQNAKIEEIDGEYIITKDFKYESAKIDMVMSSNGEDKAHIITDAKFTSYDKFDPIQLPAAK
ncbi:TPA: DUF6612 family protein [Bacillus thuringiensis]|uniref:Lipoprotein n=2 Tax=Bacillus cereus group TaxID=86661 RepID=A0A9X6KLU7_BACTU|nr:MULTISPECIES: DUF6612 family protein [Bacillus cereus group]NIE94459.1 hypothetical protein [Bacillus sp. Ab-1751]WIK96158.1 hypothetical protein QPL86_01015 [Bacillus bombysepticus]AGE75753.1 hypothetical protein HD73_0167 [Bacillus thuringiensis serovar kurstaki str. HD73]AHZ48939.1 hypothetical protein YBT1520_00820 [Bacillus thuringiensis serovar kurstaki str. YBT-1520]AIE31303.1 hypothetical protein BTK_00855 [Bacillus thuringiensis serovar kurstaki str. HD-1]